MMMFPYRNMSFKTMFTRVNDNFYFCMFLRSQRLFRQKVEKKCFFLVLKFFQEGIFEDRGCRNFYRHPKNGSSKLLSGQKNYLSKLQKLTEKSAKVAPPKKALFWEGGDPILSTYFKFVPTR